MRNNNIVKLFYDNESYIAYQQLKGHDNQTEIIFFGGFKSDMFGSKAEYLYEYCYKRNYSFTRFDYFGHGLSSGEFIDGDIGIWLQNCLNVIDQLTTKNLIIVGSSMGGWLMLLASLARPERIKALIGIAAAPDFTQDLIWDKLTTREKQILVDKKIVKPKLNDCNYEISLNLIEESAKYLLLNNTINIDVPITLLHGMEDIDVPYMRSLKLAELIISKNVNIHLIKNGDHRLSDIKNMNLISIHIEKYLVNDN
jgi:pimeloyl-ACP methyl ester carboxylesterase